MSGFKLKVAPFYPENVIGGPGVDIVKSDGNWTISLDWSKFAIISPYSPVGYQYVLVFNPDTENFTLVETPAFSTPIAPLIVSGISPISGPVAGGTSVTITGGGFTGAMVVKFGATNAASFTVVSDTQITAVSPAESAGIVDITVTTPNGTSATSSADQFTYVVPTVTFDPATIASVTLSGGNLVAVNTSTGTNQGAHVIFSSAKSAGKLYFEVGYVFSNTGANTGLGIAITSATYITIGNNTATGAFCYPGTGNIYINGSYSFKTLSGFTTATVGVAVDLVNNKIWFRLTPSGNWNGSGTDNPATNTGGLAITAGSYVPFVTFGLSGTPNCTFTANFGATGFVGAVPSGFTAGWPA